LVEFGWAYSYGFSAFAPVCWIQVPLYFDFENNIRQFFKNKSGRGKYFFKPVSNNCLKGEKSLFSEGKNKKNPQVGQEVIEKIDSRGPAIKRFFTRIPDFNNFPATTGFLVMTIKRTQSW
jgi:hypothetical protein